MASNYPDELDIDETLEEEGKDESIPDKGSKLLFLLDIFRSTLRILVIGFVIFLILALQRIFTLNFIPYTLSYFSATIPLVLIMVVIGIGIVTCLLLLENRLSHLTSFRRVSKIAFYLDFILTSVVTAVSLTLFPITLDWASSLSISMQTNIFWITDIWQALFLIVRDNVAQIFVIASFVFFYMSAFFRFISRLVALLDGTNAFSSTYLFLSGKYYGLATAIFLGFLITATEDIHSSPYPIYFLLILLPLVLAQQYLSKDYLESIQEERNAKPDSPQERLIEWCELSVKRSHRWLVFTVILISAIGFRNSILVYVLPIQTVWTEMTIALVLVAGLTTVYTLVRYSLIHFGYQLSATGRRNKLESAADMILTSILLVTFFILFVTDIGPFAWSDFISSYFYSYAQPYFLSSLEVLILATLWQVWMVVLLVALMMRLSALVRLVMGGRNADLALKTLSRSGKFLIFAVASWIAFEWTLNGIVIISGISLLQIYVLLSLIILQTVISQLRYKEAGMLLVMGVEE